MTKFARILGGCLFVFCFGLTVSAATFTVSKTADTNDGTCDADCSLREAIGAANAAAGDDIIAFGSIFTSAQTITLSAGEMVIANNGSLTINGTGADLLTIDGNNTGRILTNGVSAVTIINGATFTRGTGAGAADTGRAGAIYNFGGNLTINNSIITGNSAANGGGLNNSSGNTIPGVLTINNSIVSNNTATGSGGGMQNFSTSTVTITNSTFMGNTSNGTTGGGGGQFNGGVRITNSTFANNRAPSGAGGGLQSNGTLGTILTNVTVSGNTSATNGGGIHRGTTNTNFFIRNSIVANNTGVATSPDVTNSAGGLNSSGNNIIGTTGTSTGWIGSDLLGVNPMLGALAANGGFGMTFLPMSGSPAIDGGQNCVLDLTCSANNPPFAVTTDQRGVARPAGTAVDIGAVEVAATAPSAAIVSGQVRAANGAALPNTVVTINNPTAIVQSVRTNSFGYFTFRGITTGQTYTVNVKAKGSTFAPQSVPVNGDVTNLIITASSSPFEKVEK